MYDFCQFGHTRIGDFDDTDVGFDGAEREVGALRLGVAQAIKKRGLTHVGKSYDAAL